MLLIFIKFLFIFQPLHYITYLLITVIQSMRKHFHLIGHFLKNAQSSENMYEIFFGPLKNAQLSENACP